MVVETEKKYQTLEQHLKRLEIAEDAWLNQVAKCQQIINHHGNIISDITIKQVIDKADDNILSTSWKEIAKANNRQDIAERRLKEIQDEKEDLLDIAAVSKATEFMRETNNE